MPRMDTAGRERYETLRTMLVERRREIQEKLRSLRETLPLEAAQTADAEEQSVNDFVKDIDWALMQMKAESLAKIDKAMQLLDEGRYGTCQECEEPISSARLRALPFAIFCIRCQERQEAEAADERTVQRVPGRVFEPTHPPAASQEE